MGYAAIRLFPELFDKKEKERKVVISDPSTPVPKNGLTFSLIIMTVIPAITTTVPTEYATLCLLICATIFMISS